MNRESEVEFEGASRVHIGLEVADLERSIAFYRVLFEDEPTKRRSGYAKFELREPPLNLSLNEGSGGSAGRPGSQHFGVQVKSTDAVRERASRLAGAGLSARVEEDSTCCYAVQDKVWAVDPDGNPWEVFVVTGADAPVRAPEGSACCGPSESSGAGAGAAASACCGGGAAR